MKIGNVLAVLIVSICLSSISVGAKTTPAGNEGSVLGKDPPANVSDRELGEEVVRELNVLGHAPENAADFLEFSKPTVLAHTYARGGMSAKNREMIVISLIIANNPGGLDWHFKEVAWRVGISERELIELVQISCFYAGWPKCGPARVKLRAVLDGPNSWPQSLRENKGEK